MRLPTYKATAASRPRVPHSQTLARALPHRLLLTLAVPSQCPAPPPPLRRRGATPEDRTNVGKSPVPLVRVTVPSIARTGSPETAALELRPAEPYVAVIDHKVASLPVLVSFRRMLHPGANRARN